MKTGTKIGLFFGISGVLMGGYFSLAPIVDGLLIQSLSSQQMGIYGAVIGTILGVSSAVMGGVVSGRNN